VEKLTCEKTGYATDVQPRVVAASQDGENPDVAKRDKNTLSCAACTIMYKKDKTPTGALPILMLNMVTNILRP